MFERKRCVQGLVERFRARLLAKGFMQVFDLDYFVTVYVLAVLLQLDMTSIDVKATFMNAGLKKELYATPVTEQLPKGFVYRLKRSLYGLKQSPRIGILYLRTYGLNGQVVWIYTAIGRVVPLHQTFELQVCAGSNIC